MVKQLFLQKPINRSGMRTIKVLLLSSVILLFSQCGGDDNKSKAKDEQPQVKIPKTNTVSKKEPAATTEFKPQMDGDAKPGFQNKIERGRKRRETIKDKFDNQGNIIERTDQVFDKFGNISKKNRYTYQYDESGNRIEQWYYAANASDEPIMSSVNYAKYDGKGNKIENIFISYGGDDKEIRWAKDIFTYNSDGRVVRDDLYGKNGIIMSTVIYNIVDGLLVSENFIDYDANGNPIGKKTITYDETGRVISAVDE